MLLVFKIAQLGRLLLQILSKTHLSLERKITVIKTLYPQNAVIFTWVNIFTHGSANTYGHSNTHL